MVCVVSMVTTIVIGVDFQAHDISFIYVKT